MQKILTRPDYWEELPEPTKAYWQTLANKLPNVFVCTYCRTSAIFAGKLRFAVAQRAVIWGKSADIVKMNIEALLADGFVWRTYGGVK